MIETEVFEPYLDSEWLLKGGGALANFSAPTSGAF